MTDIVSIALWATNLGLPCESVADWLARVEARVEETARGGASLLLFPEYACEGWLNFKPDDLKPTEEMDYLAGHAPQAVAAIGEMSVKHAIAIVAGTMPWKLNGGSISNRAWVFFPDGTRLHYDKLALTPAEKDPESWDLTPGGRLQVFEWNGLRVATVICLDVEMPALSVMLAKADIDLLLVPAMTALPTGYNRVFGCAKARAVELMCAVAVSGCTGASSRTTQNPTNHGGCAVYLPCEVELGSTGIHTLTDMTDGIDGTEPFVIAHDIPVGTIRALRGGAAEVWPGAWDGTHVELVEAKRESDTRSAAE